MGTHVGLSLHLQYADGGAHSGDKRARPGGREKNVQRRITVQAVVALQIRSVSFIRGKVDADEI